MREEKILHLRSLVLVLLMVTSYALPMLSPFDPEEELLVEDNQRMQTSTGPQLVVDVENKMGFGSSNIDRNHGFVYGPNGSAYIIGEFQGTLTFGTYSLSSSGSYFDGYVAKLNNQGNWDWAVKLGGTSTDRTYGLAVDSSGNAFVTGNFYGTCHFYDKTGQSSGNLSSAGSADLYVAKLKHDGSDWAWQVKIGSSGASEGGNDIVLDSSGDAYVSGYIGNGSSVYDHSNNYWGIKYTNGGTDAFVGKIDSNGNWKWIQTGGSSVNDGAVRLDVASNGDVIVGGYYRGEADFGTTTLSHWQDKEAFVAKVNQTGWIFAKGGTGNGDNTVRSVKFDSSGDMYYLTQFADNLSMGSAFTSGFTQNTLVGKISASNNQYIWHNTSSGSSVLNGINMAISPDGNLTVVGEYSGTAVFSGQQFSRTGTSGQDGYIQGLDTSNGNQKYVFTIGSGGNNNDIMINDLMFESNPTGGGVSDVVAFSGYFKGTATFGPGDSLTSAGNEDGFIAKVKFTEEGCYINGMDYNNATEWVHCAGTSSGEVMAKDTAVDSSGNSYHTGTFQGTAVFGNTILTSRGSSDIFIAKLSSSGSWQWAVNAGGSSGDNGHGVAIDSSGNSYVTGNFDGTATFGSTSLASSGGTDIFIAKLSSNGSWQWAVKAGGTSGDGGWGIDVDSSGNSYVTGYFEGTATFGSSSLTSSGGTDIFIVKLSSSGSWQWTVKAGGSSTNGDAGRGVAIDSSGKAYVTGYFFGSATFGSSTISSSNSGDRDVFIAQISSTGSWQWAVNAGGSSADSGRRVAVDSNGSPYVTGYFTGTATFGSTSLTSYGNTDIFTAKLSSSGSWQWAAGAGGSSLDRGHGIAVDSSGNAFVTGYFTGTANFGSFSISNNGDRDAFLAQISSSGAWVWANGAGGIDDDKGWSIAVDSNGIGYIGGHFSGTAQIGMQNLTCDSTKCGMFVKTPVIQLPPADGDISVDLEFDYVNMRLKGNWQASNLVTGHDYNVSWTLKYQNNGSQISNGWPDSFNPSTSSYSSTNRTWSNGFSYGEAICYEVVLRDGDGFTGPSLDSATSCVRTPVQLTELSSTEVGMAVQRSSAGNCVANSGNNQGNICDGNTVSTWVSEDNYPAENLNIDFDLGTSAVKVDGVAVYVNSPSYTSTIKDVRLKFVNETGEYETIGVFQIERETGWQYFGGFSVMTTEIRWDVLSNYGFEHTVLFEGMVLDIQDKIFNSSADWTSTNSLETLSVSWGDVDGDGDLDLAVGNNGGNNEVYLNSGTALATTPAWTSSNPRVTISVAWGDVDGDGDLDLAMGNKGGKNEVYLNSGTALATTPSWTSSNSLNTRSVAWGDVDGDGDLDLAVGNNGGNNEVYLNSGTVLATTPAWTSSNSLNTHSVAWGDVDGDGDLDLTVGNDGGNNEVYLNSGTALATTPAWTSSNSLSTKSVSWGDVDGDGDLDLAVGNSGTTGGNNEVYLNSGTALATTPAWTSNNFLNTHSVAWSDVDGDGDLDLAVGNNGVNNEVYLNSGTALATTPAWTSNNSLNTRSVAWGDVDSDGDLDLAVGNIGGNTEVYFNQLNDGGAGAGGLPDIDIGGPSDSDSGGKNLATGYNHNCAIQKNQTISCWGSNDFGQLGSQDYLYLEYSSPMYDVDLPQGTVPISVTVGWQFTCAILSGTSTDAYCWGRGEYGSLGNGDYSDSKMPTDKVILPSGAYPVDISSGYGHSCLVSQDGDVYCWGSNSHGQLGNSGGDSATAEIVNGPNVDYTSVAVGEHHSCALTSEGDLYCWGHNGHGQLGDGTWSTSATPVLVSGSHTWKSVVPNGIADHSCAISSSDELYCWGHNGQGQLGDGSYSDANTPQLVQLQSSATSKVVDASVGGYGTSCAVLEDSSTYCWGINARGYLGDGTWQYSTTPVSVSLPEGSEVLEISSGKEHSCVLLASDQIMCWGSGSWGVIGNGDHRDVGHPAYVSGEREWNGLGKDFYHLPTSFGTGTTNSVPDLKASVSFTSLPASLNVDISSRIYFYHNYGEEVIFSSPMEVELNQPVNGLSWSKEYSFHDKIPSIAGQGNDYCIEIHLNSNYTGDSIGYGLDCVWYTPPSSQDDFAPDDFENVWGTSTNNPDSDGDGYEDWFEYWFGGDPLDSEIEPSDSDGDGLPDELELAINSDVNSADTDVDGHEDYDELIFGGHPSKPWIQPRNNDFDDCYDIWEEWNGLNTTNSDSDGDGVIDCFDTDNLDPDNTPVDSDGDGMPDSMEYEFESDPDNWDSDGDGMPDSFEYIMNTDPNNVNSFSSAWAIDWTNVLTLGTNVSITASSSHAEHPASLAIDSNNDGNHNQVTYWQTSGHCPATLEVDLGRAQYFATINFLVKDIGEQNFPRNISIEYRETTEDTWNLHAYWNRSSPGAPGDYWDGVYAQMPFSKARYVRLNCTDSTDSESNSWEIAIATFEIFGVKNQQFLNPEGNSGGETGQPTVEAFLNIDSANQTLTAGYSAQLNEGLDYDIEWRLIEADQGSCSDVPLSIDQGTVNLRNWDTVDNDNYQQIPVDYSTITDWYDEFCLQLDLMQGGNSLYVDWLLIDASGGQNNGGNGSNNTQTDTDGDGINDEFDQCPGFDDNVDTDGDGIPDDCDVVAQDASPHLDILFDEWEEDSVWYQQILISIGNPWLNQNHSMSMKIIDPNGNTVYSYFSPMAEDDQAGWWRLYSDMDTDPVGEMIDLNWEGLLGSGEWEGSSRFFEGVEYPFFEAGEYCVEFSLGRQINTSDQPMSVIRNIFDKSQVCGTFAHSSMDGITWDGTEEPPQTAMDKLLSNRIVISVLDFMDSTTGQVVSIGLAVLGFAGRMVLARGQRAKNKRVDKLMKKIRNADSKGRLKIIEMDVEKANVKNKLPRGGYGDLMEAIEARMESLGFDADPMQGDTSGSWASEAASNDWQDDFQQASDMMWEAQDMMAEAKEESAMARQAIEDIQDHFGMRSQGDQQVEEEAPINSKYVTSGIDDAGGHSGPALPSAGRMMDLDGDGIITDEEKEIWRNMSDDEKHDFFQPVTNIAQEIERRNKIREQREKLRKKSGGGKKKRGKKDKKGGSRW